MNPAGPDSGALLSIVSYNIHRCVGSDLRADADRIAEVIRELGADVVALQEVGSHRRVGGGVDQTVFLSQATGYEAIAGPTLQRHHGPFGNALLVRYPVRAVQRIDLGMPACEPRGALDVLLDCGAGLRVIATHLGLRAFERRRQIACLLDVLAQGHDLPTIVLGDFNHWLPHRGPLHALDTCLGRTPALRTFPSWSPLFALDRLWVRPRTMLMALEVHVSPLARVASDHLPLRATLRLS